MEVGEDGFDCVGGVALGFVRSLTVAFSRGDWFLADTVVVSRRAGCLFSQIVAFFLAEIGFSQRRLLFLAKAVVVSRGGRCSFSRRLVARRDHGGTEII